MRIYFMGIGGTAMGQAALLARAAGHEVLGADRAVYPPMSTVLAEAGIAVHEGYDPARLESLAPDLVVVGNAMSRGHPEVEWLLDTNALPFTSLPGFLHDSVLKGRRTIVVAGTHGKTTTTALAAFLLRENGRDPGFLIGGVPHSSTSAASSSITRRTSRSSTTSSLTTPTSSAIWPTSSGPSLISRGSCRAAGLS